jgi:hypothetical protein
MACPMPTRRDTPVTSATRPVRGGTGAGPEPGPVERSGGAPELGSELGSGTARR